MFDSSNMFAGLSDSWGGTRTLYTKTAGGAWSSTGKTAEKNATDGYVEFASGDPKNSSIGFWRKYRTTDKGANWTTMTNCQNVVTYNPQGSKELYGLRSGNIIVKSTDSGLNWTDVATISTSWLEDLAFDWKNNRIYYTTDYRTKFGYWDVASSTDISLSANLPQDWDSKGAISVATDPIDPNIVYVTNFYGDGFSKASAARSLDKGATWENLQKQSGDTGLEGVKEGMWVRVNPVTRDALFAGNCYGIWKYPSPVAVSTPTPTPSATPTPTPLPGTLQPLSRTGWVITPSTNGSTANLMIGGNLSTRWTSGRAQATNQDIVQIDLGSLQKFQRLVLDAS